ncbi:MAG: bifunctional phosphoribosyl-AMP cyclohydrolase/phosphoribosyl-ATP diphosphatase HisIE [Oligoflexales bacterium]|nr:bifunctional phosphoribosyl-AMP cyclohydrolase/phosphoribosyl-ATP diphosphatase HisIE [Oligoflexales bacterium]
MGNQAIADIQSLDWEKQKGLMPAIIQDANNLKILMLGYMSPESLERTIQTGKVCFFSRSRQKLWTKGETSGNTLELVDIAIDCDQDTILIQANPNGPTCHRLTPSCFDNPETAEQEQNPINFLGKLEKIIASRVEEKQESSYTFRLYNKGAKRIAQKVGEEGVEVALAALDSDTDELINESADLLFHMLVLLKSRNCSLSQVCERLQERAGTPTP